MNLTKLLLAIVSVAACSSAPAQWHWIDKNGRDVFSDRGPPPDVPEKNIRKQPGGRSQFSQADAPAAPADANTPRLNPEDPALAEKKKQAAEAETAKRQAEQERTARLQAESCARARQAKAGFDAGTRIARTNAKGEREFLDDAARAEEGQRIQAIIDADCQ